jgi:hypothetical protein
VDLGKTTYNLNLIVEQGEATFAKTKADADTLLALAKKDGLATGLQLLLKSASDKIGKSLKELETKRKSEGALPKASGPPTTLTNSSIGVRPLKTVAKPKKATAMKRVTAKEFLDAKAEAKAEWLKRPLIVAGGADHTAAMPRRASGSAHRCCSRASARVEAALDRSRAASTAWTSCGRS